LRGNGWRDRKDERERRYSSPGDTEIYVSRA